MWRQIKMHGYGRRKGALHGCGGGKGRQIAAQKKDGRNLRCAH
jgi:hypothetical protein